MTPKTRAAQRSLERIAEPTTAITAMTDFLAPTTTIDSDHPTIIAAAVEIAGHATNDEELARRYFLCPRRSPPFGQN